MAIKLPSFRLFSTADAKTRIFLIFVAVVVISLGIFFGARYLSGPDTATGASRVANAPAGLQSVPGGQSSPEYSRALMQANANVSKEAQISGDSAVPTLINIPDLQQQPSSFAAPASSQSCTIMCPNENNVDVTKDINNFVKNGKLPQKEADALIAMAKDNVPVNEYEAALNDLVKQGKLTPEQARQLLDQYKKQHQNALLTESGKMMDSLIKSGDLPLDTANQLLALQKSGISPNDYAAELSHLVAEGKISPQTAAALLAQYTQQQGHEATKQAIFSLKQLAKEGAITPAVAKQLAELQTKNIPVDQYADELQRLVAAGKITPAEAERLLADYKAKRSMLGPTDTTLAALIQQAEKACQQDLAAQKKTAGTPPPLPASCQKLNTLKAEAARLAKLQGNNASSSEYAEELKRAVQQGLLTPEDAAKLMQRYATMNAAANNTPVTPTTGANLPGTADFARLQAAVQSEASTETAAATTNEQQAQAQAQFAAAELQAQKQAAQAQAQRIQDTQAAMAAQAQQLLAAWAQPPKMVHQAGSWAPPKAATAITGGSGVKGLSASVDSNALTTLKPPLIKAGTILFAVLDTAVNSDYPDTPVLATVVQGEYKGAKLLGRLNLAQGQNRVSLSFNLMDRQDWLKTKSVTAFAIDPDTARTVMASNVDNHYMLRYGSLFASSFLTGYSNGVLNAGNSTTGIFGTSTSHPQLSFGNNVAVALGQVGTAFTGAVQGYVNTPATVTVNSGVGLGILFMADVTQ